MKITQAQINYIIKQLKPILQNPKEGLTIQAYGKVVQMLNDIANPLQQADLVSKFDTDMNTVTVRHYDEIEKGDTLLVFKDLQEQNETQDYFFTPKELAALRDNINERLAWLHVQYGNKGCDMEGYAE